VNFEISRYRSMLNGSIPKAVPDPKTPKALHFGVLPEHLVQFEDRWDKITGKL
jgi:hypothetical protein